MNRNGWLLVATTLAAPTGFAADRSGRVRYVGFNIRKGNNRQGPGLFALSHTPGS